MEKINFEENMKELEKVVQELEKRRFKPRRFYKKI